MRVSIWLTTFALNTILIVLFVSSLWEPFGVPVAIQLPVVFFIYGALTLWYLRCPVCRTFTSGWWITGEGLVSIYFFAPFANPGRCSRCGLSFHRHGFGDDVKDFRRRWRLDNP